MIFMHNNFFISFLNLFEIVTSPEHLHLSHCSKRVKTYTTPFKQFIENGTLFLLR